MRDIYGFRGILIGARGAPGQRLVWVQYIKRTYFIKPRGGTWQRVGGTDWRNDAGVGQFYPHQSGAGASNPIMADTPDVRDRQGNTVNLRDGVTIGELDFIFRTLQAEAEAAAAESPDGTAPDFGDIVGVKLKLEFIDYLIDLDTKKVVLIVTWEKVHEIERFGNETRYKDPIRQPGVKTD